MRVRVIIGGAEQAAALEPGPVAHLAGMLRDMAGTHQVDITWPDPDTVCLSAPVPAGLVADDRLREYWGEGILNAMWQEIEKINMKLTPNTKETHP